LSSCELTRPIGVVFRRGKHLTGTARFFLESLKIPSAASGDGETGVAGEVPLATEGVTLPS